MDTIKTIKNHRSIRNFLDKEIPNEQLNEILACAHIMPTAYNSQQVSIIVVKNKETKEKIANISGGLQYIKQAPVFLIFVADFYKTNLACEKNNKEQITHDTLDGIVAATFDAGLSMAGAIVSAESLGLGIVPIGAIRMHLDELKNILELPEHIIPLVGLCLGYPNGESMQKPRLPIESFVHLETYKSDSLIEYINEYDKIMELYLEKINRQQEINWSTTVANVYSNISYFEQLKQFIQIK